MTISKRQAQKDRTRKHLIEVAFKQFARDGLVAARELFQSKAGLSR